MGKNSVALASGGGNVSGCSGPSVAQERRRSCIRRRPRSVCRRVEGELLGGVSLNLNSLGGSDVEVLRRPLLGVGAAALLLGHVVQHDGRQAVTRRVVRTGHAACDVSLCELADGGEAVWQRVVCGEAVALHGVGGLGGVVSRRQVGGGGSRQTSRVEHGLRLRPGLTRLAVTRAGRRVLGRSLVPSGGAGGLRMMEGGRVVRERLSVHGLLRPRLALGLTRVLGPWRTHRLGGGPGRQHPRPALQHRVNGLSVVVGGHGLDHLTVLQVGLGVRRGHQRGAGR